MSAYIESFLRTVSADLVTEVFVWLITLFFLMSIYFRRVGKGRLFISYTANLLTTLGILGTFIGIVIGLLDFNTHDIDGSIGYLLAGLKTAFITSLFGMAAAILYRLLGTIPFFIRREDDLIEGIGADDIYHAIMDQANIIDKSSAAQQQLLADLKQAIVGGEDDTLITQVKLMRGDMNDNQKSTLNNIQGIEEALGVIKQAIIEQQSVFREFSKLLWTNFKEVADMISKSASEQVIEALRNVITDFNKNLVDQFGDNFKALDASVKKLVIWQENYSQQIEQMVDQYKLGVMAIDQTKDSVSIISDKAEYIPKTMESLESIMEVNQNQIKELSNHLEAFKDMRDKAVEAVPEIRNQVEETVSQIATSVQIANDHYSALLTESDKYIKQHIETSNESLRDFVTNTKEGIESVKLGLDKGGEKLAEEIGNSAKEYLSVIKEGAKDYSDSVSQTNDSLIKTADEIGKQTEVIQDHLKDTVTDLNGNVRDMVDKIVSETKAIETTLITTNKGVGDNIQAVNQQVADNINNMKVSIENVMNVQAREANRTFKALEEDVKKIVGLTGHAVEKQLNMIHDSQAQEIERVLQQMGMALAQIAGQFTKDYTQLTQAMQVVVNSNLRQ